MILDKFLEFSNAQAITATAVGTNVIPLSLARDVGTGEPVAAVFTIDVAADQTTGDEDYTFELEYSSSDDQSTGYKSIGRRAFESGTPSAGTEDADLLVSGYRFAIVVPPADLDTAEAYIGVRYTVAGTSPSVTVTAQLQPVSMLEGNKVYYPNGYSIT